MTGGAFGSILAQLLHLTAAERKTLLVAGAAAGMSATFAAPIAAMLLAVELLLFELKPRSLIPVALASIAAAAAMRRHLLGAGPLFPVPDIDVAAVVPPGALAWCAVVGALAGGLSATLTAAVYAAEDAVRAAAPALDVVAGAGRRRRRRRWARLSGGARRRLRPDPDHAGRRRAPRADAAADGGEGRRSGRCRSAPERRAACSRRC